MWNLSTVGCGKRPPLGAATAEPRAGVVCGALLAAAAGAAADAAVGEPRAPFISSISFCSLFE
jgi:hypothetical protein